MADLLHRAWPVIVLFLPAILVGLSLALAGGTAGVVVLLRRDALVALALPQVVLLGVALGLRYLGEPDDTADAETALQVEPTANEPAPSSASLRDIDAELGLSPQSSPARAVTSRPAGGATSPVWRWIRVHVGWPTLPGAVAAVAAALVLISLGRARGGERSAATRAAAVVVPSIYVAAGAAAILIVANSGQHLVDLKDRYVGIDIAVDDHLAEITVPPLLLSALLIVVLWRRWLLIAQAPAAASLAGLRPARWDAAFLILLSLLILVATNAVGPVLVTALLFLPAATVLPWCRRVPAAMFSAAVMGVLIYAGGFVLSNGGFVEAASGLPLGHSVGGLGGGVFLVSYITSRVRG
jgi:ABC-type Mn2+/Zn2+ transport system permease subunit